MFRILWRIRDCDAQRRGSGGADERGEEGTEQRSEARCSALPCNRLLGHAIRYATILRFGANLQSLH